MTDYFGDSTWGICISTSISGSGSTAYPAGDRIFFVTNKIMGSEQFLQKIKQLAGGSSYSTKDGKRSTSITISEAPILGWGSTYTTPAKAFSVLIPYLKKKHVSGASPLYLWIKNLALGTPTWTETTNLLITGLTGTTTDLSYIKGYVTKFDWEIDGSMYWIKNLTFQESMA
jgi:hypothetical protein